eukprot:Pompholyxophrys_punicea_v1_NODE_119_length_3359_cov_12.851998.p4 type:complete len:114 gc:universal NODE_119_length_3359_cov_12.851998:737-1078(+)
MHATINDERSASSNMDGEGLRLSPKRQAKKDATTLKTPNFPMTLTLCRSVGPRPDESTSRVIYVGNTMKYSENETGKAGKTDKLKYGKCNTQKGVNRTKYGKCNIQKGVTWDG